MLSKINFRILEFIFMLLLTLFFAFGFVKSQLSHIDKVSGVIKNYNCTDSYEVGYKFKHTVLFQNGDKFKSKNNIECLMLKVGAEIEMDVKGMEFYSIKDLSTKTSVVSVERLVRHEQKGMFAMLFLIVILSGLTYWAYRRAFI